MTSLEDGDTKGNAASGTGSDSDKSSWRFLVGRVTRGPVSEEKLVQLIQKQRVRPGTLVWRQGFERWVQASTLNELAPYFPASAPATSREKSSASGTSRPKPGPKRRTQPPPRPPTPGLSYAELNYAGFWLRFIAFVIDSAILTAVAILFALPYYSFLKSLYISSQDGSPHFHLLMLILIWLYYGFLESSPRQATLGKMAMRIKVTDLEEHRITFGRATGRFFGHIVSWFLLGVGYAMVLFTKRKQTLHDIMAGCLVVYK